MKKNLLSQVREFQDNCDWSDEDMLRLTLEFINENNQSEAFLKCLNEVEEHENQ